MNGFEIDFEKSLEIGPRAYDKNVGEWWNERSEDPAHKQAYRNILSHIASLPLGEKPVIVDYGCGPGNILTRLSRLFPGSEIHGIDGSSRMLERTRNRLKALHGKLPRRIRLTRHHLPDFSIPSGFADLVIYAFPHIVSQTGDEKLYEPRYPDESKLARHLTDRLEEPDPELGYLGLFMERMISRNIRSLLKKGGTCIRVEYAGADDGGEPEPLDLWVSGFQEGSSARTIKGIKPEKFFRYDSNTYFRSRVIRDVYHQTKDPAYLEGGYYLSDLKAL